MGMYGKYKPGEKAWPVTDCSGDKGFTVQADRDEADINKIVARLIKSGEMPPSLRGEPFYGDVSDFSDLQGSLIKIQEAKELFMQYPAEVRERFENDEVQMIEFLADPKNKEEAIELGLIQKAPVPEPEGALPAEPPPVGNSVS